MEWDRMREVFKSSFGLINRPPFFYLFWRRGKEGRGKRETRKENGLIITSSVICWRVRGGNLSFRGYLRRMMMWE